MKTLEKIRFRSKRHKQNLQKKYNEFLGRSISRENFVITPEQVLINQNIKKGREYEDGE
jgi:hypothetical protein